MTVYWPNGSLSRPHVTSDFNPARKNPVTGIVQPHNGIDLIGWTDVLSPVDGTVVFAGYNGGAGNEVRIRADGPTAFHVGDHYRLLHHASLYVRTGQRVSARQAVGRMGTTGQSTGVHCHFETHEWRLWNPVDPTDYMRRANVGVAGNGATPFVPPPPPKEEDDMLMLRISGAYLCALGPGIFRHFIASDPYEKIKNVARINDDWQDVSLSELPALLRTYGCDLNIWDVRPGVGFVVLDPLTNEVNPGRAWTASGAVRAAIAGIKLPEVDPTPLVEAIKKAIAESSIPAEVDELAIAKAVRGEFTVNPLA